MMPSVAGPTLFVAHLGLLGYLTWLVTGYLYVGRSYRAAAAVLLFWANLVYTGLILGAVHLLDQTPLYLAISLGMAQSVLVLLRRRAIAPVEGEFAAGMGSGDRWTVRALGVLFLAALAGLAVIALSYEPNNPDTLTYRYPRALFYLGEGSLRQYGAGDPRLISYPFAAVMLYLFPAAYQIVGSSWALVSVGVWVLIGFAVWLAARRMGAGSAAAAGAGWLAVMAPNVLAMGASGNDDSMAAMPLVLALTFLHRWWETERRRELFLGMAGVFLSAGTKLHTVFFYPVLALLALAAVVAAVRNLGVRQRLLRNWKPIAAGFVVTLPLFATFMVYTYAAQKRVADPLSDLVLHKRSEAKAAAQSLWAMSLEVAVKPWADLPVMTTKEARVKHYQEWNEAIRKRFLADFRPEPGFNHPGYVFDGNLFRPMQHYFEHSTSPGLVPLGLAGVLILFAIRRGSVPWAAAVLSLSFFGWHVGYGLLHRWISEPLGTYYAFPVVVASPALAFLWEGRWRRMGFAVLALAGVATGWNILAYGSVRNVRDPWKAEFQRAPFTHSATFREAIRKAARICVPYTFWEIHHWDYMRLNPAARYRTGNTTLITYPDTMTVLLYPKDFPSMAGAGVFSMAFRAPAPQKQGLVPLGDAFSGTVQAFGRGEGLDGWSRSGGEYFELRMQAFWHPGGTILSRLNFASLGAGVDGETRLEGQLEFRKGNGAVQSSLPWMPIAGIIHAVDFPVTDAVDTVVLRVRDQALPGQEVINIRKFKAGGSVDHTAFEMEKAKGPAMGPVTTSNLEPLAADETGPSDSPGPDKRMHRVRWLNARTRFELNGQAGEEVAVRVGLGRGEQAKSAQLFLNGEAISPPMQIRHYFWTDGAFPLTGKGKLRAGKNLIEIRSEDPPLTLSDGRKVWFLMVNAMEAAVAAPLAK